VGVAVMPACASGPGRSGNGYQEYECPPPIGKIVREDCSRSALQYEGTSFQASAGAAGIGASASYKEDAIRQADALVSMLKEQRVQLCNDFNTCKISVAEYRGDQQRLDDSYVALLALRDKMAQIDAEGAAKLLAEIQRIRMATRGGGAPMATTTSAPSSAAAAADLGQRALGRWRLVQRDEQALQSLAADVRKSGAGEDRVAAVVKTYRDDPGRITMEVAGFVVTVFDRERPVSRVRNAVVKVEGDSMTVRDVGDDEISHRKVDGNIAVVTLRGNDSMEVRTAGSGTFYFERLR